MQIQIGKAYPLGSTITEKGVNFAVESDIAVALEICLYHPVTEVLEHSFSLPGKTGTTWHGEVIGIGEGQLYGIRIYHKDSNTPSRKLLIDPYARMLSRPIQYDKKQYEDDSESMIPKSVVVKEEHKKRPAKPQVNPWQRIIYEAHVKGLTRLHPSVNKSHKGTYLGAADPAVIEHIKTLGVTTVQFMPLFAFMPEPYITGKGLTNYWGYNPVCYLAPEPRYANKHAVKEIKKMVDAYHQAGLEVILDVVFNHTAEGGEDGPRLCLRGLFGKDVYLHSHNKSGESFYANYSGCGNTVNTAHPFVFKYILDALRYWIEVIGFDGFRFDLAPGLGREPHQFNRYSGLIKAMLQDSVLKHCVLVAEPWDMGPEGYQLGAFPDPWLEVNDRYRDTVRAFWRGDNGLLGEFATRLMGSRDIFSKTHRPIYSTVNCVTYHDGYTLHDLVTYEQKHNVANLEDNRDGHNHNLSRNYGTEGETDSLDIIALREKQKRNFLACLLFSQGTPHFLAGDEISRTQRGNNNAYCQDNEISWIDWSLDKRKQDLYDFCRYTIGLRQNSELLGNLHLIDDSYSHIQNIEQVNWYKPDGTDKASEDWQHQHARAFALEVIGNAPQSPERWLLCINAGENEVRFHLPNLSKSICWRLMLDTRYSEINKIPAVCVRSHFLQQAQSLVLFKAANK